MKILLSRDYAFTNPVGQNLRFDDGSVEWDSGCAQTTAILTAELYTGKAAKDDDGKWVPAPGPRLHEEIFDMRPLLGFQVGLTLEHFDSDGKAVYDYSVTTPTGVVFHGNGIDNVLRVPSHWDKDRIVAEIISWICIGEDSGATFPDDLTPEQWQWIRSPEREMASYEIDQLIDHLDNPGNQEPPSEEPNEDYAAIEARAKDYQERLIHANQTGLVTHLLSEDSNYLSYEDIINLTPDVASMDGNQLAEFISDYLGLDWRKLDIVDIHDYVIPPEDDEDMPDLDVALADLNPLDLEEYDLEALRDYITENHTPGDIYEWYLVDSWLAGELEALGHPTLTDGSSYWWGRRTTGQYILMDGVLQEIAAKYI